MILGPGGTATNPDGTDDNFGPHCRNCHTGSSSCNQCHGTTGGGYTAITNAVTAGRSNYTPQSYYKTSAVAGLNGKCIDGGFSFPHRTLGNAMLKDELYGIDFDGTPVAAGVVRGSDAGLTTISTWVAETGNAQSISLAVRTDSGTITGVAAENTDSVCIDCHGDATYYQPTLPQELVLKGLP
jgi:hypothetical protein